MLYDKNHSLIKNVVVNQSANIAKYKDQLSSLEKASNNDEFLRKELSKEMETLKDSIIESRDNINKYQSKYSELKLMFGNYESFNFNKIMNSIYSNQNKSYFRKLASLVFNNIEYNNRTKLITFNFNLNSLKSKTIRY